MYTYKHIRTYLINTQSLFFKAFHISSFLKRMRINKELHTAFKHTLSHMRMQAHTQRGKGEKESMVQGYIYI